MDEPVVLVEQDGPVAVLTLNRPKAHNALNHHVLRSLDEALIQVVADGTARAVVITGAGQRSFCAGADLEELVGLDGAVSRRLLEFGQQVMQRIARSRVPVISAVNGLALGGGFELILATTFPVLADTATLGLPEAGLGLIPGYGGTQRLPLLIGRASAAHLMLTGERLGAERAFQLGLTPVRPVPVDELRPAAIEIAHSIAVRGPSAVAAILEAMDTSNPSPGGLAHETTLAAMANVGEEAHEGIEAFKQRRAPRFGTATPPSNDRDEVDR